MVKIPLKSLCHPRRDLITNSDQLLPNTSSSSKNTSSKFVGNFSYHAGRHTDKQAHKGKYITSLAEVIRMVISLLTQRATTILTCSQFFMRQNDMRSGEWRRAAAEQNCEQMQDVVFWQCPWVLHAHRLLQLASAPSVVRRPRQPVCAACAVWPSPLPSRLGRRHVRRSLARSSLAEVRTKFLINKQRQSLPFVRLDVWRWACYCCW